MDEANDGLTGSAGGAASSEPNPWDDLLADDPIFETTQGEGTQGGAAPDGTGGTNTSGEPAATSSPADAPNNAGGTSPAPVAGEGQAVAPSPTPAPAVTSPTVAASPAQPAPSPATSQQVDLTALLELMRQQQAQPPAPAPAPAPSAEEQRQERRRSIEQRFALDPETAAKFLTEPETVVPQLAANLYEAVMQEMQQQFYQSVPQIVSGYMTNQTREREARDAFYSAHPDLKDHEDVVMQMGRTYRTLNPNATPEQAIQGIGALARVALGRLPAQGAVPPHAASPAPAAAPVVNQPYRPAGSGAANASAQTRPNDQWAQLADEFGRFD